MFDYISWTKKECQKVKQVEQCKGEQCSVAADTSRNGLEHNPTIISEHGNPIYKIDKKPKNGKEEKHFKFITEGTNDEYVKGMGIEIKLK